MKKLARVQLDVIYFQIPFHNKNSFRSKFRHDRNSTQGAVVSQQSRPVHGPEFRVYCPKHWGSSLGLCVVVGRMTTKGRPCPVFGGHKSTTEDVMFMGVIQSVSPKVILTWSCNDHNRDEAQMTVRSKITRLHLQHIVCSKNKLLYNMSCVVNSPESDMRVWFIYSLL